MIKIIKNVFLATICCLGLSCSKDKEEETPVVNETIDLTQYFVGGVLGANKSVYVVQFLENNRAVFVNSSIKLVGEYTLKDNELTVEINDPNNYRIMKYFLDKDNQITFSYYQALQMPYLSTGQLLKVTDENQFAGKTFKGAELRMGKEFRQEWFYKFDEKGKKYGTGEALTDITPNITMEFLNGAVFHYKNGSISEIGFINGSVLTTSRVDGLFYSGTYELQ